MSYERCTDHGLARCPVCAPRAKDNKLGWLATSITSIPGSNWSPEDALDAPNPGTSVPTAGAEKPDAQALEALERQKPAAIEVDFGDDEPFVAEPESSFQVPVTSPTGLHIDHAEEMICLTCNKPIKNEQYASVGGNIVPYIPAKLYHMRCVPTVEAMNKKIMEMVTHPDPLITVEKTSTNPLVAAAQQFAAAILDVDMAQERVKEAEEELDAAKKHLDTVLADRDAKKLALRSQVE